MKRASLTAAVLIALVANAFALVHAWRNRTGPSTSDIVLTEREVPLAYSSEDDSSIGVTLAWRLPETFGQQNEDWLDAPKLAQLGFDTSVPPSSADAPEFYRRARPHQAYVALEYNGPAWEKALAAVKAQISEHPEQATYQPDVEKRSRLIAIDAGLNPAKLRIEHPDAASVMIVPATIGVTADQFNYLPTERRPQPRLRGFISEIPSGIHVPLPFSRDFSMRAKRTDAVYRVHLRYGASFEPWITSVDFTPDDQANHP
jgi:hypothetical protein